MKLPLLFIFLLPILCNGVVRAQDFNEQIYYEYPAGYTEPRTGKIHSVSDTLAEIRFTGPMMGENFSFACSYRFSNDTLYMKELESDVDLNRFVEYTNTAYLQQKKDSIYLGYQVYYYGGGDAKYDDLFFEIGNVKAPNSGKCDSHCALMKRPAEKDFVVKIWSGTYLLDQFDIHLPDSSNVIRMSKDIFSGGGWWNVDGFLKKIPPMIEIDHKMYILITDISSYSFGITSDKKMKITNETQKVKNK